MKVLNQENICMVGTCLIIDTPLDALNCRSFGIN